MSTKTTFKRVALVAVASLGFGVLTSVAPAMAGTLVSTGISAGTPTPARVGETAYATITVSHAATTPSTSAVTDDIVVAAKITTAPSTSVTKSDTNTSGVYLDIKSGSLSSTAGSDAWTKGAASATITRTTAAGAAAGVTSTTFDIALTPDVAGTYTVLVSTGATSYTAGNNAVAVTFTTVGAPTKLTATAVKGTVVTSGTFGQLFALSMTDANGNDTVLGSDEGIAVSLSDSTTLELRGLDTTTGGTAGALTAFGPTSAASGTVFAESDGVYYVRVRHLSTATLAAGSATLTFKGSGLLAPTLVTNTTVTKVATTALTAPSVKCTTSTDCPLDTSSYTVATTIEVAGATSLTVTVPTSTTAAAYYAISVADDAAGYSYDSYLTQAAVATGGTATTSVAYTTPAPATLLPVAITFGTTSVMTMSYAVKAATTLSVANSVNSVLSALAGTNTFTAKVVDQYGAAVANQAVTVKVSGRNTVATKTLGVTDANGLISYSLTDAGTTGTLDTVTFGSTFGSTANTALAYINYGTVTVDSVKVTGGSTVADAGVAGTTKTAISAADNGPDANAKAVTATVKDASGNLLAGVPVTFTVSSGLVKKTAAIDYATVYTNSAGEAVTNVLNWIAGTQTITATAGGKSGSDYFTWVANDATTARVLTAAATGDIVSLKVVDRFGNGVQGVAINLSRTGAGLFGNGASTQDITTDKLGSADVRFAGSGTVIAELAATYTQAYATAGNITTKAATAATAGTTAGTGATLTPAGVSKVSIAIEESANSTLAAATAASDAAAEATDAANAATDAANAAAEAADAATAAAQDAADAVAALATQVTEMMDAMKKQITALTNLVIKIQKKVKA